MQRFWSYLLCFAFCAPAWGVQAAPKKDADAYWHLSRNANPKTGAFDYCATESSFSNGLSLAFARNPDFYTNIVISFSQPKLERETKYPLTLVVDHNPPLEVTGFAADPTALVIPLKKNEQFIAELAKGKILDMRGPRDSVKFSLQGAGDALTKLQDCVERSLAEQGGKTESKNAPAASTAPAPAAPLPASPALPDTTTALNDTMVNPLPLPPQPTTTTSAPTPSQTEAVTQAQTPVEAPVPVPEAPAAPPVTVAEAEPQPVVAPTPAPVPSPPAATPPAPSPLPPIAAGEPPLPPSAVAERPPVVATRLSRTTPPPQQTQASAPPPQPAEAMPSLPADTTSALNHMEASALPQDLVTPAQVPVPAPVPAPASIAEQQPVQQQPVMQETVAPPAAIHQPLAPKSSSAAASVSAPVSALPPIPAPKPTPAPAAPVSAPLASAPRPEEQITSSTSSTVVIVPASNPTTKNLPPIMRGQETAAPSQPAPVALSAPAVAQAPAPPAAMAQQALEPAPLPAPAPPAVIPEATASPASSPVTTLSNGSALPPLPPLVTAAHPFFQQPVPDIGLASLLANAGIAPQSHPATPGQGPFYTWSQNGIIGSGMEVPSSGELDAFVLDDVDRRARQCKGKFTPSVAAAGGSEDGVRISEGTASCTRGTMSSNETLLYYQAAGRMGVIALETPTENQANAIALRDQLTHGLETNSNYK